MKKSKFTETQIVSILKQADAGVPVSQRDRDRPVAARPCTGAPSSATAPAMRN
jgi:hypothetical protein